MYGAATRYRELLIELMLERNRQGGPLPEPIEAERTAELDRCWHFMSDAEQEEAESWWAAAPMGPDLLASFDVKVGRGDQVLPRKAA